MRPHLESSTSDMLFTALANTLAEEEASLIKLAELLSKLLAHVLTDFLGLIRFTFQSLVFDL